MINATLEKELFHHLNKLPPEQRRQVLDFARTLSGTQVQGVPGQDLIRFGGTIEMADLAAMAQDPEIQRELYLTSHEGSSNASDNRG